MLVYFIKSDGSFGEEITVTQPVATSAGVNSIYVYWDNETWVSPYISATIKMKPNDETQGIEPAMILDADVKTLSEIGVEDGDYKYFEYDRPYRFAHVIIPDGILAVSGLVDCTVRVYQSQTLVQAMQNITFMVANGNATDSGVTLSQYNQIMRDLSSKADDSSVVHKAGAETITGSKTFTNPIIAFNGFSDGFYSGTVEQIARAYPKYSIANLSSKTVADLWGDLGGNPIHSRVFGYETNNSAFLTVIHDMNTTSYGIIILLESGLSYVKLDGDGTELISEITTSEYAQNYTKEQINDLLNNKVSKTGNESISGTKSFTGQIIVDEMQVVYPNGSTATRYAHFDPQGPNIGFDSDLRVGSISENKDIILNGELTDGNTSLSISDIEDKANKDTSSLSSSSTTKYPSSKVVADSLALKVNVSDIVNDVSSSDTDKPLSAKQGKELNDRINNIGTLGRFLSYWNCATGKPYSDPTELPYTYRTGDFFIIKTLGTGTNYIPSGSQYTGAASTTVATDTIAIDDYYRYDGTNWIHITTASQTAWGTIVGDIAQQSDLVAAFNGKVNTTDYISDNKCDEIFGTGTGTNSYALNSEVVKLTGTQFIEGNKVFTSTMTSRTIEPTTSGAYNLGAYNKVWDTIYTDKLDDGTNSISVENITKKYKTITIARSNPDTVKIQELFTALGGRITGIPPYITEAYGYETTREMFFHISYSTYNQSYDISALSSLGNSKRGSGLPGTTILENFLWTSTYDYNYNKSSIDSLLSNKANTSGDYANINAGGLVSTTPFNNTTNYVFRDTANGGDINGSVAKRVKKVEGNLIKWNQLVSNAEKDYSNSSTDTKTYFNICIQFNVSPYTRILYDNVYDTGFKHFIFTYTYPTQLCLLKHNGTVLDLEIATFTLTTNHKYFLSFYAKGVDTSVAGGLVLKNIMLIDLTACGLDSITTLEQFNATDLGKLVANKGYLEYSTGAIAELNMTNMYSIGFNQFDEVLQIGGISSQTGEIIYQDTTLCTPNYIRVDGQQTIYVKCDNSGLYLFFYDANKNYLGSTGSYINNRTWAFTNPQTKYIRFQTNSSYGTTYNHDICINLSHSGTRNGEYKPYEKHTYSNAFNGYAIGNLRDTKLPNGTITRKIGKVDLGTLNWQPNSAYGFYVSFPQAKTTDNSTPANLLCPIRNTVSWTSLYASGVNNNNIGLEAGGYLGISSTETDTQTFKNSLSGVYLYYELLTPTTEQGTSYDEYQLVDDYGTEGVEYANGYLPVPLNHETQYTTNYYDYIKRSYNYTSGNPNKLVRFEDLDKKVIINRTEHFTSSATLDYSGVSFTIPANKRFAISIQLIFNNSRPIQVAIGNVATTDPGSHTILAKSPEECCGITFVGYTTTQTTYYIYAKYGLPAQNQLIIRGWYED